MNRNNRGFLLAESLVVSTFVLTILIFLFVQFRNVVTNYKTTYSYNNVESIYNLGSLSNYISTNNIKIETSSDKPYTIIYKDETCQINVNYSTFCNDLLEAMDAKLVIYTSSDILNIKNYVNNNDDDNISQSMRDFINKISAVKVENKGRLLAEFNDGTFATVAMNDSSKQNSSITGVELCNNDTVTSGDGLYKDTTETGRCVYKGGNPNNYITLGSDMYRIIAVESDGTLKVIKNGSIGDMPFDLGYGAFESNASSLAGTRYTNISTDYCYRNNGTESEYYGCNIWGSRTTMLDSSGNNITTMPREVGGTTLYNLPEKEAYLNTYLNNDWYNSLSSTVQSRIATHLFNVGLVHALEGTLANTITQEKAYKWKGKVGLINVSDYVNASTDSIYCTHGIFSYEESYNCYINSTTYNWISSTKTKKGKLWTITPPSGEDVCDVFGVYGGEGDLDSRADAVNTYGVFPAFYLSSDITLTGEGTEGSPYTLN